MYYELQSEEMKWEQRTRDDKHKCQKQISLERLCNEVYIVKLLNYSMEQSNFPLNFALEFHKHPV
jgi:hypothetical protein